MEGEVGREGQKRCPAVRPLQFMKSKTMYKHQYFSSSDTDLPQHL